MSEAMNFQPLLYEVAGGEEWGQRLLNGSYTGLFGEVMSGRAQMALGKVVLIALRNQNHIESQTSLSKTN